MNRPVKELENGLLKLSKIDYSTIDRLMKNIGKTHNVDMKTLHNNFVGKHKESPDSWIKRKRGETNKKTKSCGCSMKEELKKNLTPQEISKKHNVSLKQIERQLSMGIKVEKEHTNNIETAEKIALQHLSELPNYYTKLKSMETKKTFKEFLEILEAKSPAWQRKEGQNPSGGLNEKGRRSSPGNLKPPVTKDPSKLKKGSKSWNRRHSFCSRMSGMKRKLTSAKTARDPNSRINKSLRKWNC